MSSPFRVVTAVSRMGGGKKGCNSQKVKRTKVKSFKLEWLDETIAGNKTSLWLKPDVSDSGRALCTGVSLTVFHILMLKAVVTKYRFRGNGQCQGISFMCLCVGGGHSELFSRDRSTFLGPHLAGLGFAPMHYQ